MIEPVTRRHRLMMASIPALVIIGFAAEWLIANWLG
jgi:hypothetical protein